jgi:hypothetical protein
MDSTFIKTVGRQYFGIATAPVNAFCFSIGLVAILNMF